MESALHAIKKKSELPLYWNPSCYSMERVDWNRNHLFPKALMKDPLKIPGGDLQRIHQDGEKTEN